MDSIIFNYKLVSRRRCNEESSKIKVFFSIFLYFQLVNLQTHTMAPVRSLSYNFLTSILSSEMVNTNNRSRNIDQIFDLSQIDEDDSETEETSTVNQTINQRKEWSRRESMVGQIADGTHFEMNKKLQALLSERIKFNF